MKLTQVIDDARGEAQFEDHDWSHGDERAAEPRAIPGVGLRLIENAGRLLSLDAPEAAVAAIVEGR